MRDVVNLEKYLLEKTDKTFIKPLDNKGFNKLNNKVARGEAQDVMEWRLNTYCMPLST